ncbi:MAG: hypothetical protein ACRDDW_03770 [Candidatus Rhabdochlamydia sp.]
MEIKINQNVGAAECLVSKEELTSRCPKQESGEIIVTAAAIAAGLALALGVRKLDDVQLVDLENIPPGVNINQLLKIRENHFNKQMKAY